MALILPSLLIHGQFLDSKRVPVQSLAKTLIEKGDKNKPLELSQSLHRLLDGSDSIQTVDIVKIDIFDAQALQAALTGCTSVLGAGIAAVLHLEILLDLDGHGKLGGQENIRTSLWVKGKPLAH